ncbi:Signal peptidase I Serine peptidase. MEROPS family S26B [Psychrobacillus sp. OK028]|uniref:signal peptidase I SipW n=1 Tax=Psychrobacillus sp. OK028 TaxID=1884359 RepID=UPI000882B325|nr:signal peptidase I [Psychrobacillus sp. OK028]SDM38004.1 Signal peptidase I Serine peptidase. MEROPS family S26B [Psychrobacillus sp. OK028]
MRYNKKSKKENIKKWVNNIVTGILMILLISVATIVVISKASGGEPEFFGYQLKTVLSGSMEPGIQTGSIIAVKKAEVKTGFKKDDVITFLAEEDILITHRITEVVRTDSGVLYRTKGDNNNAEDMNPVLSENVVAEYTGFTLPYAGYFINFTQSKNGALLLLIPGFLLLIYSAFTIWKVLSEIELRPKKQVDIVGEDGGNNS